MMRKEKSTGPGRASLGVRKYKDIILIIRSKYFQDDRHLINVYLKTHSLVVIFVVALIFALALEVSSQSKITLCETSFVTYLCLHVETGLREILPLYYIMGTPIVCRQQWSTTYITKSTTTATDNKL